MQIRPKEANHHLKPGSVLQSNRLMQILLVSTVAIVFGIVFFIVIGWGWNAPEKALIIALAILSFCMWLVHTQRERFAAGLFLLTMTLVACALVYTADGLHDEAISIFPGLLLFSCMFGSRNQFRILFATLICFIIFIFVGHHFGWHTIPDRVDTTLSSMVNVLVILMATGFFSYVLANDLRKALEELNNSKSELQKLNGQLELRVKQRTELYEESNRELQESIAKLENAQGELMHLEKLASLGSMVAGISHELNTPISNALLASTSMKQLFEDMILSSRAGNLKKSTFDSFLETTNEMSDLVSRATKRAADLIVSFKQVAIDHTSEQRRVFDLREVIEDNIAALQPSIRKRHIKIENAIPPGVRVDSFPGPLGQIITNLLQNSMLHGFPNNEHGTITLAVNETEQQLFVEVTDNGVGMTPQIIAHIFDPFFTTKFGKGGSGLGLSISHRLATSVLGGSITVSSVFGSGASFRVSIPKIAPFPLH